MLRVVTAPPTPAGDISPRVAAVSAHPSPKSRKQSRTRQLPGMFAPELGTQVKAEAADEIWCLLCRDSPGGAAYSQQDAQHLELLHESSASLSFCCVPLGIGDLTAKAAWPGANVSLKTNPRALRVAVWSASRPASAQCLAHSGRRRDFTRGCSLRLDVAVSLFCFVGPDLVLFLYPGLFRAQRPRTPTPSTTGNISTSLCTSAITWSPSPQWAGPMLPTGMGSACWVRAQNAPLLQPDSLAHLPGDPDNRLGCASSD